MIVGFVGDVHGNAEALARALGRLEGSDLVICLGDVVGGPDDEGAARILRSRGILTLKGNHDHWAARLGRYRVSPETRRWLGDLPMVHETADFLAYHSEFTDDGLLLRWHCLNGSEDVSKAFRRRRQRLLFCGHTHIPSLNVRSGAGLTYLGSDRLRSGRHLALEPGCRYLVNAGQVTDCVVTWNSELDQLRFAFLDGA